VILDGVFNHTGRDFFAFRDLQENRENSRFRDWYCNVNFYGDNEYGDGFSYDNWGGYNLLVKLNQRNPEVRDYILDTVRFWVSEFDIDGLRLDAADVLDFDFMKSLRGLADSVKEDFWLMGEVIHGEYSRWANDNTLHSVTNYHLHKALYSAHNDHNYFEIAHTVKRQEDMGLRGLRLYNFVDNHDVERIWTRLRDKRHFTPVHILLYTLPGIPSVYYGSEYGIEGRKERGSDASLRPELHLEQLEDNACYELVRALGKIHQEENALTYGDYRELQLTTTQYAFARGDVLICVNNSDSDAYFDLPGEGSYRGALLGGRVSAENGRLNVSIHGCSGEIWIPEDSSTDYAPLKETVKNETIKPDEAAVQQEASHHEPQRAADPSKPYEEMTVEELQAEILAKMAANGPVTDRMKQDVTDNVYRDSLLNWVRSFNR
jgi:glycosidase